MGTITLTTVVLGLFSAIGSVGVVILASMLNSKKALDAEERTNNATRDVKISELEKKFVAAENTFVTNSQLKVAIQEAFEPYKEDNKEIKVMLKAVSEELVNISRDLAVIHAIRRSRSETDDNIGDGR